MGRMDLRRGTLWLVVVAVVSGLAAATALAAPRVNFTVAPTPPNQGQPALFTCQPCPGLISVEWDLDGSPGFELSGRSVTTTFQTAGPHTVRMRLTLKDLVIILSGTVTVSGLPSADFTWNPASPVAGDSVDLVSTSTDFEGPLAALSWDLDGDGRFGDGSQPLVRLPFPEPGTYDIGLRVIDSDGKMSTVRKQIVVLAAPPSDNDPTQPGSGSPESPATRRPSLMSPFPIVRIAGAVLPGGALVRVLSVRAPRGARVRLRCVGKGCPAGSLVKTSDTRLVRFRKFERRLRAGIRLKLFVRQEDRIGKYTSFLIRAGAPPKRVDRCLFPAQRAPRRCP